MKTINQCGMWEGMETGYFGWDGLRHIRSQQVHSWWDPLLPHQHPGLPKPPGRCRHCMKPLFSFLSALRGVKIEQESIGSGRIAERDALSLLFQICSLPPFFEGVSQVPIPPTPSAIPFLSITQKLWALRVGTSDGHTDVNQSTLLSK